MEWVYQVSKMYQVSLLKLIREPSKNGHVLIFYLSRQLEAKTDLSLIDKIELGRLYQNYTGQNPVHVRKTLDWWAGVYPSEHHHCLTILRRML